MLSGLTRTWPKEPSWQQETRAVASCRDVESSTAPRVRGSARCRTATRRPAAKLRSTYRGGDLDTRPSEWDTCGVSLASPDGGRQGRESADREGAPIQGS